MYAATYIGSRSERPNNKSKYVHTLKRSRGGGKKRMGGEVGRGETEKDQSLDLEASLNSLTVAQKSCLFSKAVVKLFKFPRKLMTLESLANCSQKVETI